MPHDRALGRSHHPNPGRILVVDDDDGMRRTLAIMLRREGFQVTETGSVSEAVPRLQDGPWDLLIADLRMQPLSGIDLLALARARQPDCPVILITAFGSPEVRAEAYRLGAAAFLEKPLEATKFVRQVHRLVTGARPPDSAGGEIR